MADKKLIDELKISLASTYALYLNSQNFHWNITGENFLSLHEFLEEQYKALADAVDELAERIRQIGEPAPASFDEFNQLSKINTKTGAVESTANCIKSLIDMHKQMLTVLKNLCNQATQADDPVTEDIAEGRVAFHEKTIWMLQASC